MKKNISLILLLLIGFLVPILTLAQSPCPTGEFCNPAGGFLVDLRNSGRENTFGDLLAYLIQLILGLVAMISVLFIIIGGYQYIMSRGDEEQASTGKKTLSNAIIGLIIVLLSYTIVVVIYNALT